MVFLLRLVTQLVKQLLPAQAIITHGAFIDLLLKALLGQLPDRSFFFSHDNTAITRVDFRIEHLPPELIT